MQISGKVKAAGFFQGQYNFIVWIMLLQIEKFAMKILTLFFFSFQEQGLDHIAENILSYLDARSLCAAELVCKEWQRVISEGMLWKKLIERMVRTDPLWKGLSERRGWYVYLQDLRMFICVGFRT